MEEEYIFSKELREKMEKFGEMDVSEALASPDFFEAIMEHAGIDREKRNAIWKKVGREDLMNYGMDQR